MNDDEIFDCFERSVKRVFCLIDTLSEQFGIDCDVVPTSKEDLHETTMIDLSEVRGDDLSIRWGFARRGGDLEGFIKIEGEDAENVGAVKFIKRIILEDLAETLAVVGGTLDIADDESENIEP